MRIPTSLACLLLILAAGTAAASANEFPRPQIEYAPETYLCPFALEPPVIDGLPDDPVWQQAMWTREFVDIEGHLRPRPQYATRAAMAWDADCFYVIATLEEPHAWGTLVRRDSVIYHDNDFEIFIDPDGDTHNYYELEINALGTEWDLFLTRPYRDGAQALNAWDIAGLKTAVHIDGTLNDPADTDTGWTVEIAIPWKVLGEAAGCPCPPDDGDRWWVNFSRVQWDTHVEDGAYVKDTDPQTGKALPEHNWVWSPQGLIAMHYPERWGIVQFSEEPMPAAGEITLREEDTARAALYEIYYILRDYQAGAGTYDGIWNDIDAWLDPALNIPWTLELEAGTHRFEVILELEDGRRMSITEDGRLHRYGPAE